MGAMRSITLDRVELRHGAQVVVSGLSGVLDAASLIALVGPNGAGKTTLLRALAGLHPLGSGHVDRDGITAGDIALLAQGSLLDRSFPITCLDVVALAAARLGPFQAVGGQRIQAARAALERVGLRGFEGRQIRALSAGQFQRVLFARTILQDAALILLDEPFTAVDAATTRVLLSVIDEWHAQGRVVVAVLHDMDMVRRHFSRTLTLGGQRGTWDVPPPPDLKAA